MHVGQGAGDAGKEQGGSEYLNCCFVHIASFVFFVGFCGVRCRIERGGS